MVTVIGTEMIYAFIQSSENLEVMEQQKRTVLTYAQDNLLSVDVWLDPSSFDLAAFKEKDVLLLEKTFRLGKDVRAITTLLQELLSKGVVICSCEDNLKLGEDYVSSTVWAHVFGVVSDIAEEVRSRLTKEALAMRKQNGLKLGRPFGKKSSCKLDAQRERIRDLLQSGKTEPEVCRLLNIPRTSLWVYVKNNPDLKPEVLSA